MLKSSLDSVTVLFKMPSYYVQFNSVAQLCLTFCDSMNLSTPGLPVHHQLLGSTQTRVSFYYHRI